MPSVYKISARSSMFSSRFDKKIFLYPVFSGRTGPLPGKTRLSVDKNTANDIMNVLINLNKNGKTVVIVTHDRSVAEKCNRIIELSDGEIISDKENIPA